MSGSHVEVARVFSPGEQAPLPDLTRAGPVTRVERVGEAELDATYFDTPGLALLKAGVTLRRRSGGADEGWHLELPVGRRETRHELHLPLGVSGQRPPEELVQLVDGWTRGVSVAPVARIRTTRTTHRLVGPDGRVLAELADDRVSGLPAQLDAERTQWREWEVELVDGDEELLDILEAVLAAAEVHRSEVDRKIALVLGTPSGPEEPPRRPRRKDPARLHVHQWLIAHVRELTSLDPAVRRGEAGGVHRMRKASRKLRSALGTYRSLVDRQQIDPVRKELRWLGRALSTARDDEVVIQRLVRQMEREDEQFAAPARRLLDDYAAQRAARDQHDLVEVLGSPRYHALRTALDALVDDPPWTAAAEQPARTVLQKRLDKEWQRVRDRRTSGAEPHEVRKAAKRLRYAYELVEPAWGARVTPARKAARELTRVLGEQQDSVVAREWLRSVAAEAVRAGVPSFSFGRLHALEERREQAALEDAGPVWRELRRAARRLSR